MNYLINLPVIAVNDTVYTLGFFINIFVILIVVLIIIPIIKEIFKQGDKEEDYHWETVSMYDESLFVDGDRPIIKGDVDTTTYYIDTKYNPVTSIMIDPNVKINWISPKESYPTICKCCGASFKLTYDGTGKCPYCDTYYSPVEVQ